MEKQPDKEKSDLGSDIADFFEDHPGVMLFVQLTIVPVFFVIVLAIIRIAFSH